VAAAQEALTRLGSESRLLEAHKQQLAAELQGVQAHKQQLTTELHGLEASKQQLAAELRGLEAAVAAAQAKHLQLASDMRAGLAAQQAQHAAQHAEDTQHAQQQAHRTQQAGALLGALQREQAAAVQALEQLRAAHLQVCE
jgi:peptidoglycan hydrolase CwlO-like protein